jgi:hypothetical protein
MDSREGSYNEASFALHVDVPDPRVLTTWELNRADSAKVQKWLGLAKISTGKISDKRKNRPEKSPTFQVEYREAKPYPSCPAPSGRNAITFR